MFPALKMIEILKINLQHCWSSK